MPRRTLSLWTIASILTIGCKAVTNNATVKDAGNGNSPAGANAAATKFIVITDMEPDDRMAIQLLAANIPPSQIAFMGTTVMHAARKKALLCRMNRQLGYGGVPVYQGQGHDPKDYEGSQTFGSGKVMTGTREVIFGPDSASGFNLPTIKSNASGHDMQIGALSAARTYLDEGQILGEALRTKVSNMERSSNMLTEKLVEYLSNPANPKVKILLLAAPTELEAALARKPELAAKIDRVYLQGGWVPVGPTPIPPPPNTPVDPTAPKPVLPDGFSAVPTTEPICSNEFGGSDDFGVSAVNGRPIKPGYLCVTTYNWDLDIGASRDFMARTNIPMELFSSHIVKNVFPGGSINTKNGDAIWSKLKQPDVASLPSIKEARFEISSWDQHIIQMIPKLKPVIAPYIDCQFTPADPSLVVSVLAPALVPSGGRMNIGVSIDPSIIVPSTGYGVTYQQDRNSKIELITKLDPNVFVQTFANGMAALPAAIQRNSKDGAQTDASCDEFIGQGQVAQPVSYTPPTDGTYKCNVDEVGGQK